MRRWIVAVVAGLMPVLAVAQANAIPAAPHLLVRGHAEGRYVPDRFTVHLRVSETDMQPDLARQKVEAHMQQIFASLEHAGAMRGRTTASSLEIVPRTDYRDGRSVFIGTEVSRGVRATFNDPDRFRRFLGELQASEAVQIAGVNVARSDVDGLLLQLRKRAMADSQAAAKGIAAAYGMHVKGVYSVSEVAPDFTYGIQAGSWGTGNTDDLAPPPPPPPAPPAGSGVVDEAVAPALRVGTILLEQNIYAVYLTGS